MWFDWSAEPEAATPPTPAMGAPALAELRQMRRDLDSARAWNRAASKGACCSSCASHRADEEIRATVRAAGKLVYPWATEIVEPSKASLGDPAMLVGVKVTLGHDGQTVGFVKSANRSGDTIAAVLDVNQEGLDAIALGQDQISLGYQASVDSRGVQIVTSIHECSLVWAGRCGEKCSVDPRDRPAAPTDDRNEDLSQEEPPADESGRADSISPDVAARRRMISRNQTAWKVSR